MEFGISHDWADKSPKAKTRWFRSLTLEQRLDMWTEFSNFALAVNPSLADKRDVRQTTGRVQILELPQRQIPGDRRSGSDRARLDTGHVRPGHPHRSDGGKRP